MRFVNLTPHDINFVLADGSVFTVEPSGMVARCGQCINKVGDVNGIPITETCYGDVVDLPDPEPDTIYIVSALVAQRVTGRQDVFIPADSVRDDKGRIIGCRSLGRVTA